MLVPHDRWGRGGRETADSKIDGRVGYATRSARHARPARERLWRALPWYSGAGGAGVSSVSASLSATDRISTLLADTTRPGRGHEPRGQALAAAALVTVERSDGARHTRAAAPTGCLPVIVGGLERSEAIWSVGVLNSIGLARAAAPRSPSQPRILTRLTASSRALARRWLS